MLDNPSGNGERTVSHDLRAFVSRLLQSCDVWLMTLNGLRVDLKPDGEHRTLGGIPTIKSALSVIPGVDYKLWKVANKYGGFDEIMAPWFVPPEKLYVELAAIGYSRQWFDRSRAYARSGNSDVLPPDFE